MDLVRRLARIGLKLWAKSALKYGYFYQVMEKYGPRLATDQPLVSMLPGRLLVSCNLRDHVQRHIYFQGAYEPIEAYLFSRLLRTGATVVDAGGNIGQYTLLAAAGVGPTGAVHTFEPVPHNYERLTANVAANHFHNVHANRAALWQEAGELCLGRGEEFEGTNDGTYSVGVRGSIRAPAVRFDEYRTTNRIHQVDLIKMDIEGAEWSALQGMTQTLEQDRPIVLIEVNRNTCELLGYDPNVFWSLLCIRFGYTAWQIGHRASDWRKLANPDGVTQANVLFTPTALPKEIASGWNFKTCVRWARG